MDEQAITFNSSRGTLKIKHVACVMLGDRIEVICWESRLSTVMSYIHAPTRWESIKQMIQDHERGDRNYG